MSGYLLTMVVVSLDQQCLDELGDHLELDKDVERSGYGEDLGKVKKSTCSSGPRFVLFGEALWLYIHRAHEEQVVPPLSAARPRSPSVLPPSMELVIPAIFIWGKASASRSAVAPTVWPRGIRFVGGRGYTARSAIQGRRSTRNRSCA